MTYKPRFYWDEETINYFVDLNDLNGEYHMMKAIKDHVYNDCTPEGNETYPDLYVDLEWQVIEAIEKDDNRKL